MMSRYVNEEGPPIDSRFDGGEPFPVSPDAAGISLDSALHDFGPAAIDDLIPRIRALAFQLDTAHDRGHVHGALAPSSVIITDDATALIAGRDTAAPYGAPEVVAGGEATPESDQFSLAAVTYAYAMVGPYDRGAVLIIVTVIVLFGLFVAGTMYAVKLWHQRNLREHPQEVEELLAFARSESGHH